MSPTDKGSLALKNKTHLWSTEIRKKKINIFSLLFFKIHVNFYYINTDLDLNNPILYLKKKGLKLKRGE